MTTPDLVPRHRLYVDPMADCFCEMDESATGNYVTFEDYERLQSELERERKRADEAEACITVMRMKATPADYEREVNKFLRKKTLTLQSRLEALEASATADAERLAAIEAMAREQRTMTHSADTAEVKRGWRAMLAIILDGKEKP